MWYVILGMVAFPFLVTASLPWVRVQKAVFALVNRVLYLAVFSALLASAVFYYRPDFAPGAAATAVQPLGAWLPAEVGDRWPGLPWLVFAVSVLIACIPVLMLLKGARVLLGIESRPDKHRVHEKVPSVPAQRVLQPADLAAPGPDRGKAAPGRRPLWTWLFQ